MPFEKVLLTGASGFVGAFMARALLARGCRVHGLQRSGGTTLPEGVIPLSADLNDPASLASVPREWDAVVHLAGASIPSLFVTAAPVAYNVQITLNLLDHVQAGKVLLVSSCHVYAPSLLPRAEDGPVLPQGRYGLSKHLVEQLAPHYRQRLDVRVARPFNHLGPGQRPELVIPSLLRRLSAAPHDTSPVLM
jgi:GDP-4-dehydro-6-deoxy-D-mannose reductase